MEERPVEKQAQAFTSKSTNDDGSNHPFVFSLNDYIIEGKVTKITNDGLGMDRLPTRGDITRYVKLQSLAHHTKIIAHDLNNVLSSIIANADLAGFCVDADNEVGENISHIRISGADAKSLVKKLQARAEGNVPNKKNIIVRDLFNELSETLFQDSSTKVSYLLESDSLAIDVDKDLIHEAFQNILLNAMQAMSDAGHIEVTAEDVMIDKQNDFDLISGEYVRITISDHGCGMSKEDLAQAKEPFFTTKASSRGLGLTVAAQIIKNHNGYVDIESEEIMGTSVHIYLPAIPRSDKTRHNSNQVVKGNGRILVMDDRSEVRSIVQNILEKLGYEVDCTVDGFEAVEQYQKAMESGKKYDAVILDLNIPGGMGAEKTMVELLKIDPEVKALVSSGFHDAKVMKDYEKFGFCGYVTKPFTVSDFSRIISNIISGTGSGTDKHSGNIIYSLD